MSPSWTALKIAGRLGLKRHALTETVADTMRRSASASFLADEPARVRQSAVADAAHGAR